MTEEILTDVYNGSVPPWIDPEAPKPKVKEHRHYWRKDGTCACGAVKGQ